VTSFSRQKCKNLKIKKRRIYGSDKFYIVVKFHAVHLKEEKVIIMIPAIFGVTHAHRVMCVENVHFGTFLSSHGLAPSLLHLSPLVIKKVFQKLNRI